MSIKQFLSAIKKSGIHFIIIGRELRRDRRKIRTRCGLCPIEALAAHMGIRPRSAFLRELWDLARQLGLSDKSTTAIVNAADYTYLSKDAKYAPLSREIRRSLRALTEKEK